MKKIIVIIISTFFCSIVCIGQTQIKIQDKGYANITLRIYTYSDLLTHTPQLLASETVNENGVFAVNLKLKEPQLLYIPLYSFQLIFYAEPNKELLLKLPSQTILHSAFAKQKIYARKQIPLFIEDNTSLNSQITEYDKHYNSFLKKNFGAIYQKKNGSEYAQKISLQQKTNQGSYFKSYTYYKEAYVHYVAGEREELLAKKFAGKPLLIHNTAYVSLLRKLALPYATDFAHNPKYRRLYTRFQASENYQELSTVCKGIAATKDAAFNEHFLIYMLQLGMQQKNIAEKVAYEKLELIKKRSLYKVNRQLAQTVIKSYTPSFRGKQAPSFKLQDVSGVWHTNQILNTDKPTLVAFLDGNVNNKESISTLKTLQAKHKDTFQVILFSADATQDEVPKDWTHFTIPYYSYIFRDYHLGRFPYYILIDKDGCISKQTWQQYLINLDSE